MSYNLDKEEKAYLKKIVINTRNRYLKKVKYNKISEVELELLEDNEIIVDNSLEINLEIKAFSLPLTMPKLHAFVSKRTPCALLV